MYKFRLTKTQYYEYKNKVVKVLFAIVLMHLSYTVKGINIHIENRFSVSFSNEKVILNSISIIQNLDSIDFYIVERATPYYDTINGVSKYIFSEKVCRYYNGDSLTFSTSAYIPNDSTLFNFIRIKPGEIIEVSKPIIYSFGWKRNFSLKCSDNIILVEKRKGNIDYNVLLREELFKQFQIERFDTKVKVRLNKKKTKANIKVQLSGT